MRKGSDQNLIECMTEIRQVLTKHNVMASIFLANGKGFGEYGIETDTTDWSLLKVTDTEFRVTTDKNDPNKEEKLQRTVNALWSLVSTQSVVLASMLRMQDMMRNKLDIDERDDGSFVPRSQQ